MTLSRRFCGRFVQARGSNAGATAPSAAHEANIVHSLGTPDAQWLLPPPLHRQIQAARMFVHIGERVRLFPNHRFHSRHYFLYLVRSGNDILGGSLRVFCCYFHIYNRQRYWIFSLVGDVPTRSTCSSASCMMSCLIRSQCTGRSIEKLYPLTDRGGGCTAFWDQSPPAQKTGNRWRSFSLFIASIFPVHRLPDPVPLSVIEFPASTGVADGKGRFCRFYPIF
jgi:hypothetical protein